MLGAIAQMQFTTEDTGGFWAALGAYFIVWLIVAVVMIVAMWKIFDKAGKPGWAVLIPIYNIIVMLEIVGRPVWWIFLMLIPFVNFVVGIIVIVDLAKSFGKDVGFAIGMILLSFIFYPILGFGSARYLGPAATITGSTMPPPPPPAPPAHPIA
jgi:hypothetical protein